MDVVETFRFARVLFGLAPSPYRLEGVLESHLDAWADRYPDEVALLRRSMYVDDLLTENCPRSTDKERDSEGNIT